MRLAVIGDIHGNKYALESVLERIETQNVDFIISTGDLVGYMPYPNEVINLIRKHKVVTIQGNHDQTIGQAEKIRTEEITSRTDEEIQDKASLLYTNWCITDENRKFLKSLATKLSLECNGLKISIVHGSPKKINEYLYEDQETLARISKIIEEDVIICGHTHIPYFTKVEDKYFINAGSVGKPKHGDSRSTYILVEMNEGNVSCSIEKVPYNLEAMINDIKANRMIANELIPLLEKGI